MEASSIPAMVPGFSPAPPAADNVSVILWVVGALVIAVVILLKWIKDYLAEQRMTDRERLHALETDMKATQTFVNGEMQSTIIDNKLAMQANTASNIQLCETINGLRMEFREARRP